VVTIPRALSLRWLLVLVAGAGVVAMHSLMDLGGCAQVGRPAATVMSSMSSMFRPSMFRPSMFRPAADTPRPHAFSGTPGPASSGSAALRGTRWVTSMSSRHTRHRDDSSMLGRLCLAVLDVLGFVLLVGLLLVASYRNGSRTTASGRATDSARPRAPPPSRPPSLPSLARLCVSRR
jgi:hypothetical protein